MSLARAAFEGLAGAGSSPVAQLGGGCNPSGSPSPWAPARFGPRHDEHRAPGCAAHPGQAGHPPPPAPARRPAPPAGPAARSPVLARAAGPWLAARPLTSPALNRQRTVPHSCLADRYEDGGHHASPGWCTPHPAARLQSPQTAGLVKPGRSRSAAQIPAGHRPAVHSASPPDVAGSPDSCQPRATRC